MAWCHLLTDLTATRQASEELLDLEAARVPVALVTVDQNLEVVRDEQVFLRVFSHIKRECPGQAYRITVGRG